MCGIDSFLEVNISNTLGIKTKKMNKYYYL